MISADRDHEQLKHLEAREGDVRGVRRRVVTSAGVECVAVERDDDLEVGLHLCPRTADDFGDRYVSNHGTKSGQS